MKKYGYFFIALLSCIITSCGNNKPQVLKEVKIDSPLYPLVANTYFNQGEQVIDVKVDALGAYSYVVYALDENGVVSHSTTAKGGDTITFKGIKSNTILCASQCVKNEETILTIEPPPMINDLYPNYYDEAYQSRVFKYIENNLKKKPTSIKAPYYMCNPYGTDELSMYFYFKSEEEYTIDYQVITTSHHIFNRSVLNDFSGEVVNSKEHEFLAHGLIAGATNYVIYNAYKEEKLIGSYTITKTLPSLSSYNPKYTDIAIKTNYHTATPLSNGLYAFSIGNEHTGLNRRTHTALMDNYGDIRWFIPMNDYFFNNIFINKYQNQNCLIYAIDYHQLAYVNYFGQMKKLITLDIIDGFRDDEAICFAMHHDFGLDNNGNLIILAGTATSTEMSKTGSNYPYYAGRYVIRYNIMNDSIDVIVDTDRLLKTYQTQVRPIYPESQDWFHPNTVQYFHESDGDYVHLSSREISGVFRVKLGDVIPSSDLSQPLDNESSVSWVLSENKSLIKKEPSLTYLTKQGKVCVPILGQHSSYVTTENIIPNRQLPNNECYLVLFSNNTKFSRSPNEWDIDPSVEGSIENVSKGMVYLINRTNNTYENVYEVDLLFSGFQSSFTYYQGHFVCGCSTNLTMEEFTNTGEKIATFSFYNVNQPDKKLNSLGYRIIKFDL